MFDYKTILEKLELSKADKERLLMEIREEFPDDDMMFELHVIRAANSMKKRLEKQLET